MKSLLIFTGVYTAQCAWLYAAFYLRLDGAMNVLKFIIWLFVPIALALWSERAAEAGAKVKPSRVRYGLNRSLHWVQLGLLVWFGHFFTALAWAWFMASVAFYQRSTKELRDANNPRNPA